MGLQEVMFGKPGGTIWTPPRVSELPAWPVGGRVAVDVETRDDNLRATGPGVRRGGYVCGYSFAFEDGPSYYVPLRHDGGDNVEDPDMAVRYLREQAGSYKGILVGANLGYDLDYLAQMDVNFNNVARVRDVIVAEPLIDEMADSYSLDTLLAKYGLPLKAEDLLRQAAAAYGLDPKKDLWQLPARYVGAYAEGDVTRPLTLLRRQERRIEEMDLGKIYDLESDVVPVLVRMRRRGVRVDEERLGEIERWAEVEEAKALELLYKLTGVRVAVGDTMKASAVAPALQAAGIHLTRTETGQLQIDRVLLESCGHPAGASLLRARKLSKLRTTFVASVRRYLTDGRIHCVYNQMARQKDDDSDVIGARFGRMSCTHPNLQQQPSRDEFAAMWRSIYLPDEGALWASDDYRQQEPRLLAHYAILAGVPGADRIQKAYRDNPDLDPHQMIADLTGLERTPAKTIFLGLCYGMGSGKLARSLGLPIRAIWSERQARMIEVAGPEAQRVMDSFDEGAPHVRALARVCETRARERGYITTIGGRRCRFPMVNGRYEWTHKALNRLIQGSGADQTKMALVAADRAGFRLQLQIHDEINASVENEAEGKRLAELMCDVIPLNVPVKASCKVGATWGATK